VSDKSKVFFPGTFGSGHFVLYILIRAKPVDDVFNALFWLSVVRGENGFQTEQNLLPPCLFVGGSDDFGCYAGNSGDWDRQL
jgi:hypothetical protein